MFWDTLILKICLLHNINLELPSWPCLARAGQAASAESGVCGSGLVSMWGAWGCYICCGGVKFTSSMLTSQHVSKWIFKRVHWADTLAVIVRTVSWLPLSGGVLRLSPNVCKCLHHCQHWFFQHNFSLSFLNVYTAPSPHQIPCVWLTCILACSASFLAEISVWSPRKLFIFII